MVDPINQYKQLNIRYLIAAIPRLFFIKNINI